jgi:hypothetical protein
MAAADGPERLRRRQIFGLLLIVVVVLLFTLARADWHGIFPRGWWRW